MADDSVLLDSRRHVISGSADDSGWIERLQSGDQRASFLKDSAGVDEVKAVPECHFESRTEPYFYFVADLSMMRGDPHQS
jgi:hypothetical protein